MNIYQSTKKCVVVYSTYTVFFISLTFLSTKLSMSSGYNKIKICNVPNVRNVLHISYNNVFCE